VIEDGLDRELFYEGDDGALIFDMGWEHVPALLRKKDGTTLYLTRDVAAVKYREETYHPERILYVVDHAQSLHFKQVFEVSNALRYKRDTHLEHVSFGRMHFSDPEISTRKGTVIKLEELLDEAVRRAGSLASDHVQDMPREELARLREVIGVGAVKYAVLHQDRNRDIVFDWDKIVSLDGDSAPYLLYAYARAHHIANKMEEVELNGLPRLEDEEEIEMMRMMVKFPEVLENALLENKPHSIAGYLHTLAHQFNHFYSAVQVVNAETELQKRTRLGIVRAFMFQLKTGLGILGIPVLERM
jgi:arginyl-tRNA synthetase